ncbi:MAG: 50S ribosomal protein L25 [Chloroflexi bacterium]|nr:50S ribosomal protein L25 [Chloroflexota bacterium]
MSELQLEASKRTVLGKKVRQLRRQGITPVVLYGPAIDPRPLQVDERALERTLALSGRTQLIDLKLMPEGLSYASLAREIQVDTLTQQLLHVDFQAVVMDQEISASIPLVFDGEPRPMMQNLGVLVQNLDKVEVSALPMNLPAEIRVDLTSLAEVGQKISVADLPLGPTVRLLSDPEEWVAQIVHARVAETTEVVDEEALESVEAETEETTQPGEEEPAS